MSPDRRRFLGACAATASLSSLAPALAAAATPGVRPGIAPPTGLSLATKEMGPIETTTLTSKLVHDLDLRSHEAVLAYVEFKDVATVRADLSRSNWQDEHHRAWCAPRRQPDGKNFCATDPQFGVEHGLAFMRFGGTRDIMAAHLFAPPSIRHAYARYVMVIDPDVLLYMTEKGVKLPGLAGTYSDTIFHPPHAGTKTFSWRMEHGPKNNLTVRDYLYDVASGGGYGNIRDYGRTFPVGVPVVIEQELDVDANHGRLWINDALVGERTVVTDVDIEELFLNFYHGGMGFATQPIHYKVAAACIARHRIGVPPELAGVLSRSLDAPSAPSQGTEPRLPPAPTWIVPR